MSLYNLINGVTGATYFVLPMLNKHPDEYPRFRDCFLKDSKHPEYDNHILVYTRVGGNNRSSCYGEEELYKHPNYVGTYDDTFDSTFGTYVFTVPEKWKEDYKKFLNHNLKGMSKEYKEHIYKIYPKIKTELKIILENF